MSINNLVDLFFNLSTSSQTLIALVFITVFIGVTVSVIYIAGNLND